MENKRKYDFLVGWTNICRFILSAVFIFSGFVKANDLHGTEYKIQDYLLAFGLNDIIPSYLPFLLSLILAIVEFCVGVYLFFGIRRRTSTTMALLMMGFMTPLTLWLAVTDKVLDCGCFGDVIILSNWETFWKNIIFLIAAVSIFKWKAKIKPIITSRFDWLVGLYTFIYILYFSLYCYRELPLLDFRPYHISANIRNQMEVPKDKKPTVYDTKFILEKNGKKKEFTLEDYPDSTWTFIDSKTVIKERGYEPPIKDFFIESFEDGEDITADILDKDDYTFLLIAPQLAKADDSSIDLINELYDYALDNKYQFYCITSSSANDIEKWKISTGAEYPFAIADETMLKTMIRSNPGVILLKKGTIINKWSVNNLPNEYQLTDELPNISLGYINEKTFIHKIFLAFGWFVMPLMLFSVIDIAWETYKERRKKLKK